ncbi:Flagellar biosynthesis protein FlhF [Planctomycetes bacterium MalM25]|nr:Flagellar biosynthesis protein FlhF [Planctomycetes bacterium MalM25]
MHIKTFRARTLREALAKVRAEFGDGAAVLHTREVNAGPIARVLRGRGVEVAATPDRAPLAEQAAGSGAVMTSASPTSPPPAPPTRVNRIAERLDELDELLEGFPHRSAEVEPKRSGVDPLVAAYGRLIEADLSPALARELIRAAEDSLPTEDIALPGRIDQAVVAQFQARLSVTGPIRTDRAGCHVVALVGPTGVGKTTTLAKLAANARLHDGARVGLVTVDTYRVAAVDQLKTYAEIIDLPMKVVANPTEMREAIAALSDLDLVLIDTAGRSPRDSQKIDELRSLLEAAAPSETHLVLSVTATASSLADTVERFDTVSPSALLLTKLDESPTLGHVAETIASTRLPVSCLTDGQNVPEDIRVASVESLAKHLLGRASR